LLALKDVLASVEERYPVVLAALAEREEASGAVLGAEGGFDPSVKLAGTMQPTGAYPKQYAQGTVDQPTALWGTSLFAGYRIATGSFADYDGKLVTNDDGQVRGGFKVPILRDGPIDRRRAGVRSSELSLGMARLSVEQQKIEARRLATFRYWDWVAAGARLEVIRDWLKLARDRDEAISARVARGDVPDLERQENRRTILQREAAYVAALRDVRQTAVELSLFWRGTDGAPRVPAAEETPSVLPDPEAEPHGVPAEAEAMALSERPEVKRLQLQEKRARVEKDLADNQKLPGLDVVASLAKDLGPGDEKRGKPVFEASVYLDIPVLNRVARGRAQSADAALRKTREQLRLAENRAVADVQSARAALDAARQRTKLTADELDVARRLAQGELRRFDLGESTMLLVNLREQASTEAQIKHIDALVDYSKAHGAMRAAIARNASNDPG
jgi:outer membrane protein TolC